MTHFELAVKISEIIQDYRQDDIDGFFYSTKMSPEHVIRWVNQFDEEDRGFLLTEFLYILPNSYIPKSKAEDFLIKGLNKISEDFGFNSLHDFICNVRFLSCQEDYKSQSEILKIIHNILLTEFNINFRDSDSSNAKYWIYIDDVLASGSTFKKNIKKEFNKYEDIKSGNIIIICMFMCTHALGLKNTKYSIEKDMGVKVSNCLRYYRGFSINNDPRDSQSNLNFCYPKKCESGTEFLSYIENAFERDYPMRNEELAFRLDNSPENEVFFSSPQARDRYESILLNKGIELMQNAQNINAKSLRPLGMTNPSYKTLGTGSHFFTWRNISNTCPIVFWWEASGWYPLFPVKNRGL